MSEQDEEEAGTMNGADYPLPLVHMNGTGRDSLKRDYDAAAEAFREFLEAWRKVEFHPRDYYPMGPDAWARALEARRAVNSRAKEIEEYLHRHRIHLYDRG
jgi:hypothetical protein